MMENSFGNVSKTYRKSHPLCKRKIAKNGQKFEMSTKMIFGFNSRIFTHGYTFLVYLDPDFILNRTKIIDSND